MPGMVRKRYAAVWSHNGDPPLAGSLVLGSSFLTFDGTGHGRKLHEEVPYDAITAFELDRSREGRIAGRASLVLTVGDGNIRLGITETGALPELVEHLTLHEHADEP